MKHVPVLLKEVLAALKPKKGHVVVDCTVGLGGHSAELLERGVRVIGLDLDPANLKEAQDRFEMTAKLPRGEAYLETECPRGQMGFYIVGDDRAEPLRARAKSSCFCNLSVSGPLCQGVLIADVPAIVGSLDIVMGEIDR